MKNVGLDGRWTLSAAAAALVLFAVLQIGYVIGLTHRDESPRNYDPFGYLRQAQLFQTYGIIGGLDTSFREPTAGYLKEVAQQIDPNPSSWNYQIAPPAHHYEARTDQVINQYPPGTGFFLHFYREGVQQRSSQFVVLTLAFLFVSLCLWISNSPLKILAVVLVGTPLVVNIFRESFSYSIHLSLAFAVLIGALGTLFFFQRGRGRIAIAAFIALLIGLSASVRISNILFFFGYIPILWVLLRSSDRAIGLPIVAIASLVGILPLAAATQINVGSLFQTTYAEHDRITFILDPAIAWKDLSWYFGGTKRYQLINWLALFALGGAITFGLYQRQPLFPILPTLLNLIIGIGFFAFHSLVLPWYLMSHAIGTISGAATYMWLCAPTQTEYRYRLFPQGVLGLIAVASTLLLSGYFFQGVKPSFDRRDLAQKLRNTDIVYACETAGLFVQSGIYAACVFNGSFTFAEKLLLRVSSDGRRQFVVVEDSVGQALLDQVCPGAKKAFLTVSGFNVFMIPPSLFATAPDCK